MLSLIFSIFPRPPYGLFRPRYGQKRTTYKTTRERFLLPEEWQRIRAILVDCPVKVRVYFTVLLLMGCRRGELLRMEWAHVDLRVGLWHKPHTKNGKSQTMPLPPETCTLLAQIPKTNRYVFVGDPDQGGTNLNQPWSPTAVRFWWSKIRKAAGLPDVWIHDLRRTCASWMAIHGENTVTIQHVLNHANLAVTQVYARLNQQAMRDALTRHSERVLG